MSRETVIQVKPSRCLLNSVQAKKRLELFKGIVFDSLIVDGVNTAGVAALWSTIVIPASVIAAHTCPGTVGFSRDIAKLVYIGGGLLGFAVGSSLWLARHVKPNFDSKHKNALLIGREILDCFESLGFSAFLAVYPAPVPAYPALETVQRVAWAALSAAFAHWPITAAILSKTKPGFKRAGILDYLRTTRFEGSRKFRCFAAAMEAGYNSISLGSAGSFIASFLIDFLYNSTHNDPLPYQSTIIWSVVGLSSLGGVLFSIPKSAWKWVHIPEGGVNALYFALMFIASTGVCLDPALGSNVTFLVTTFLSSLALAIPSAYYARENPYDSLDVATALPVTTPTPTPTAPRRSCFDGIKHKLSQIGMWCRKKYHGEKTMPLLPTPSPSGT